MPNQEWYIDRSRNIGSNKEDITYLLMTINELSKNYDLKRIDSQLILNNFPKHLKSQKNPNAILTFCRDVGYFDRENKLGDNTLEFLYGRLSFNELVFELLFKRGFGKPNYNKVKPVVVIFSVMAEIYKVTGKEEDCYLTFSECNNYLYQIKDNYNLMNKIVKEIVKNRKNETNFGQIKTQTLDILFNGLETTGIFEWGTSKKMLKIKQNYLKLAHFIADNSSKLSCSPIYNDDLSSNQNNKLVYEYLGNKNNGIIEIIPKYPNSHCEIKEDEVKMVFDYLFGIANNQSINQKLSVEYGIYKDFECLPYLVLRKIGQKNKKLSQMLINYLNDVEENFDVEKAQVITQAQIEINGKDKKVTQEELEMYINTLNQLRNGKVQRKFKKELMTESQRECMICGSKQEEILIASHIKPYCRCENAAEAGNKNNGLLLCALHDSLFDKGLLTFNSDGRIVKSTNLCMTNSLLNIGDEFQLNKNYLTEERKFFLNYHLEKIFKK